MRYELLDAGPQDGAADLVWTPPAAVMPRERARYVPPVKVADHAIDQRMRAFLDLSAVSEAPVKSDRLRKSQLSVDRPKPTLQTFARNI